MILDPQCIVAIAEDYQLKNNVYLILRMIAHEPVREYEASVVRYEARATPSSSSRLEKRVANLEVRNTLLEAELVLLRGQLDRASLTTR